MTSLHKHFIGFDSRLNITPTKAKQIRTSELNIKRAIKKYFSEQYVLRGFKYSRQGSYSLKTLIRTKNDTCDLDFGIRIFPFPKVSAITMQKHIVKALALVNNSTFPTHKKKCVRLEYHNGYHIDITTYGIESVKSDLLQLATKDGWEESNPTLLKKWFEETGGKDIAQLRRLVKYFKAWADNKGVKMPKGVALTILVAENYISHRSDDTSLIKTARAIETAVNNSFVCIMPVEPYDNLFDNFSYGKEEYFLKKIEQLINDGEIASAKSTNDEKAIKLWKRHLGKFF